MDMDLRWTNGWMERYHGTNETNAMKTRNEQSHYLESSSWLFFYLMEAWLARARIGRCCIGYRGFHRVLRSLQRLLLLNVSLQEGNSSLLGLLFCPQFSAMMRLPKCRLNLEELVHACRTCQCLVSRTMKWPGRPPKPADLDC